MPTFILIKNGEVAGQFTGAAREQLQQMVATA